MTDLPARTLLKQLVPAIAVGIGSSLVLLLVDLIAEHWLHDLLWPEHPSRAHIFFVLAGTGIAVGLILDGQIYQGAASRAGEIGHVCMRPRGPLCNCGRRGCLEALASGPAIARQAQTAIAQQRPTMILGLANGAPEQLSAEIVAEAARQGDRLALEIIGGAADYIGPAIAGLINVLDLQCVIVGGGLAQMGDLFLDPIRSAVYSHVLDEYRDTVPILPPALGRDAGAIGAAAVLLTHRAA
jgi:glucokinase